MTSEGFDLSPDADQVLRNICAASTGFFACQWLYHRDENLRSAAIAGNDKNMVVCGTWNLFPSVFATTQAVGGTQIAYLAIKLAFRKILQNDSALREAITCQNEQYHAGTRLKDGQMYDTLCAKLCKFAIVVTQALWVVKVNFFFT